QAEVGNLVGDVLRLFEDAGADDGADDDGGGHERAERAEQAGLRCGGFVFHGTRGPARARFGKCWRVVIGPPREVAGKRAGPTNPGIGTSICLTIAARAETVT